MPKRVLSHDERCVKAHRFSDYLEPRKLSPLDWLHPPVVGTFHLVLMTFVTYEMMLMVAQCTKDGRRRLAEKMRLAYAANPKWLRDWVILSLSTMTVDCPFLDDNMQKAVLAADGTLRFKKSYQHDKRVYQIEECTIVISLWYEKEVDVAFLFDVIMDRVTNKIRYLAHRESHIERFTSFERLHMGWNMQFSEYGLSVPVLWQFPKLDSGENFMKWYVYLVRRIHSELMVADNCTYLLRAVCGLHRVP